MSAGVFRIAGVLYWIRDKYVEGTLDLAVETYLILSKQSKNIVFMFNSDGFIYANKELWKK